jgi:hypothetical protein
MTTIAINNYGFRFEITDKTDGAYRLQIDYPLPWGTITAHGLLVYRGNAWVLDEMTFENAHAEVELWQFINKLREVRVKAYPEVIAYYEANNKPVDIVSAINSLFDPFKKAI